MIQNHKSDYLLLYRNLEKNEVFCKMVQLNELIEEYQQYPDKTNNAEIRFATTGLITDIFYLLLTYYTVNRPHLKDGWQDYLLNLIIADVNPFSTLAQKLTLEQMGQSYTIATKADLCFLEDLFQLNWVMLQNKLTNLELVDTNNLKKYSWDQLHLQTKAPTSQLEFHKNKLKDLFLASSCWSQMLPNLARFYQSYGTGLMGQYWAFRTSTVSPCPLVGIDKPDPIQLEQLEGYEHIKEQLLSNTDKFISGLPANNVLLYGDRGTGKSSMVKALVHRFGSKGLRVVELTKAQLGILSDVISLLKQYPQKFIIFIDDLSFEDTESDYKELKAVLEGSLEVKPHNILIYATSNRRHLIKESFTDRSADPSRGELRSNDTEQEKLSLSDRFGITLVFPSPNQNEYLAIVKSIAEDRQIKIPEEQLKHLALKWALWQNGRSGRTAKQFVDNLEGDILLQELHQKG
ncbi:MAG: ATP-binding protein [Bacillota bacterium]|nr:ATP-binding protein [Bacillota bacterium]